MKKLKQKIEKNMQKILDVYPKSNSGVLANVAVETLFSLTLDEILEIIREGLQRELEDY